MNRIKEVLKSKRVTQKELALRLGVSEPVVSNSISGNPTLQTLNDIAKALNVRVSELIDEQAIDIINCPNCGAKLTLNKKE